MAFDTQTSSKQGDQPRRSWYFEHPKRIYWGQLTASNVDLYTAPAAPTLGPPPKVMITEIAIVNTDTATRAVTLYLRTGAAAASNALLSAVTIAASTTTVLDLATIMEAGEILTGVCDSASKVNLRISGVEYLTLPTA